MSLHPFRVASILTVAALGVGVAGCSSSSKSSSTTTTTTAGSTTTTGALDAGKAFACTSVDPAAIKAVLGSVPTVEEGSAKGVAYCAWYASMDSYVAVNLATIGMFSRDFDPAKKSGTPVSGIGDEAYIAKNSISGEFFSPTGKTLWVRKGSLVYAISIDTTKTPNPTEAQLKAIAAPFIK